MAADSLAPGLAGSTAGSGAAPLRLPPVAGHHDRCACRDPDPLATDPPRVGDPHLAVVERLPISSIADQPQVFGISGSSISSSIRSAIASGDSPSISAAATWRCGTRRRCPRGRRRRRPPGPGATRRGGVDRLTRPPRVGQRRHRVRLVVEDRDPRRRAAGAGVDARRRLGEQLPLARRLDPAHPLVRSSTRRTRVSPVRRTNSTPMRGRTWTRSPAARRGFATSLASRALRTPTIVPGSVGTGLSGSDGRGPAPAGAERRRRPRRGDRAGHPARRVKRRRGGTGGGPSAWAPRYAGRSWTPLDERAVSPAEPIRPIAGRTPSQEHS